MDKRLPKSKPKWADVKRHLVSFDRAALLGLLQDLYAADRGNRAFLHARFGLGEDPLQPYKETLEGSLWPDVFRGRQASVSTAKGAISRYRKAIGDPVGLAELLVFYCERAAGFCAQVDHRDVAYLDSFVRAFQQALRAAGKLPSNVQKVFLARLDRVRRISRQLGNGVGESMDILLSEFDLSVQARAHSRK